MYDPPEDTAMPDRGLPSGFRVYVPAAPDPPPPEKERATLFVPVPVYCWEEFVPKARPLFGIDVVVVYVPENPVPPPPPEKPSVPLGKV